MERLYRVFVLVLSIFLIGNQTNAQNDTISRRNWHRKYSEQFQGTHSDEALKYLKEYNGSKPQKVLVAIIDSGLDTDSPELEDALWFNQGEGVFPDGRDNDKNGYIDDLNGWNFIGSADGKIDLTSVGTQEYREFQRLHKRYKDFPKDSQDETYLYYKKMRKIIRIDRYFKLRDLEQRKKYSYYRIDSILQTVPSVDRFELTLAQFMNLPLEHKLLEQEAEVLVADLMRADTSELLSKLRERQEAHLNLIEQRLKSVEDGVDKRTLLGDDMTNGEDRFYGNNKIKGEGLEHGTLVASFVAGAGNVHPEIRGVYPDAKLMILRIVPDRGDEYDKDVATAIRYAVDNGASIINMSFGKYCSPQSELVQEALDYALMHDVLLVHSAGNDCKDIDKIKYYPDGLMKDGKVFPNYLCVGATDYLGQLTSFSNYGKRVSVYASGKNVWGTSQAENQKAVNGTSFSAPIVSGISAMLRAYFPKLKADEIKEILIKTARPLKGVKEQTKGCVDALAAVKEAERLIAERAVVDWAKIERASEAHLRAYANQYYVYPHWLKDGRHFYYETTDENGAKILYLLDAKTGKQEPLFKDMSDFATQYYKLVGKYIKPNQVSYYGLVFDENQLGHFYWKKDGRFFRYDRAKGLLSFSQNEAVNKQLGRCNIFMMSSDEGINPKYEILTKGYNLFLKDKQVNTVKQITFDGKDGDSYAYQYSEELRANNTAGRGEWWGDKYLVILKDKSQVREMTYVDWLADKPKTKTYKMPLAGDKYIGRTKILCFDSQMGKTELITEENLEYRLVKDVNKIYYTRRSRSGDKVELCLIDLNKGFKSEVLISETIKPHINLSLFNYQLLNNGEQIIWWSERTGRGNYYLYNKEGKLIRRLTKGKTMVAGKITLLLEKEGVLVFEGYGAEKGHNPYYRHYYKVNLSGGKQTLLTPEDAQHDLEFSTKNDYFMDSYSRMDLPTHWKVGRLNKPKRAKLFSKVDRGVLEKMGWQEPKLIKLKAKDKQTDLYGILYLPYNYDKKKVYPLITNVYPGPQSDLVPRKFSIDDNGNQTLANMGCLVLNIASRGSSPLRGKDFYCYGYGNLRDYPLEDNKYCIEQLAKLYPIDMTHIGIYGHSGGAFQTVAAMCTYPDFYKVGFAASGNHDNNIYINWWGEVFHGSTPVPTNIELLKNLKGKLMLTVGGKDKNVPMGSTVRLANALIKEGKAFDYFFFPEAGHDLESPYYQNLIRYYFAKNLLGLELNDTDIINHR